MDEIIFEKGPEKKYRLCGLEKINSRKQMKLNIFLNAISDAEIHHTKDIFEISFSCTDTYAIARCLQELWKFLENNGFSIKADKKIVEMLDSQQKFETKEAQTAELLRNLKATDVSDNIEFSQFCEACDMNLQITLRDYQYKSAFLLSVGKGGFDFSVPGAGKTIITYAAYAYLKQKGIVNKIFIVGPGSAYNAWNEEYHTCFGKWPDFENLAGESSKDCALYLKSSTAYHKEISFINTEKIRILEKEIVRFLSLDKTMLVIDEAHKIKNPDAAVTNAALEITKYAVSRILLTGTPMPNGYEDLYSLTNVLSPFKAILPYQYSQLKGMTKKGATDKEKYIIHNNIDPYFSRISKKYLIDKGELKPYITQIITCDMDDEQNQLYERLNDFCGKLSDDIDEDFLMNLKKAILIRKMQISANPALLKKSIISSMDELRAEYSENIDHDDSDINLLEKADRELMKHFSKSFIVKLINKYSQGIKEVSKNKIAVELTYRLVSEGKKVLLWDIFVHNMDVVRDMLQLRINGPIELVNGSVSGLERQAAIKRFRAGKSMVLLANPATLAESISLHKACQNAIYINKNFNAAQFMQSKDRIHRINMPEGTTAHYYFIENKNSVDAIVRERLIKKEKRILAILDSDELVIGGAEMEDTNIMSYKDVIEAFMR